MKYIANVFPCQIHSHFQRIFLIDMGRISRIIYWLLVYYNLKLLSREVEGLAR